MDIAEEAVAGTAAQGDLAEVVARAGAMAMAAAPSHHRRPPSPSPAAADHSHVMSRAAGQIMAIPPACYDEEQELRPAAACGDAVMFDVPSSMVVDPYHQLSSSAATAPPHGHGGYWLPPQQISQQACYGLDVAMGGAAAADADGDEPMMMRISPVTPPPPSHHQIMKRLIDWKAKLVLSIFRGLISLIFGSSLTVVSFFFFSRSMHPFQLTPKISHD
jgi:hypothetical protein